MSTNKSYTLQKHVIEKNQLPFLAFFFSVWLISTIFSVYKAFLPHTIKWKYRVNQVHANRGKWHQDVGMGKYGMRAVSTQVNQMCGLFYASIF